MALPNLAILPGFLGSYLYRSTGGILEYPYWWNPSAVISGSLSYLTLGPDGITPADPNAGTIVAPALLGDEYNTLVAAMTQSFNVLKVPYDWRLDLLVAATTCLNAIEAAWPGQDYYVVAHSLGGLVARFMWLLAGQRGTQGHFKRLVTLGTPHWGTYSAVRLLGGLGRTYQQIYLASLPAGVTVKDLARAAVFGTRSQVLDKITATWPAVYMLFPNFYEPNQLYDPLRSDLFNVQYWQNANTLVDQGWLGGAIARHAQLADPSTQPPPNQIVCVVGRGRDTPSWVQNPLNLSKEGTYGRDDGDRTVTAKSALLATATWGVWADHWDIPRHPILLQNLPTLILNGLPTPTTDQENPGQFTTPGAAGPANMLVSVGPTSLKGNDAIYMPPAVLSTIDPGTFFNPPALGPEPYPKYCPQRPALYP